MRTQSKLALSACVFALVGCATTPPPTSEVRPVPQERLLAYQNQLGSTSASLVVTRDAGLVGSGCYYALSINGSLAARFDVSERAVFFLEPGEVLLRVGRDPLGKALCARGQDEWTQRETYLKGGETKYFRMSLDMNGKSDIQRADP